MKFKCGFFIFAYFSILFPVCHCHAAEISAEQAKRAVGNWISRKAELGEKLNPSVEKVATYSTADNVGKFHVATLTGGGFVITSADTQISPIIAFSASSVFSHDENNPLWVLLNADIAARTVAAKNGNGLMSMSAKSANSPEAQWAELLPQGISAQAATQTITDIRVAPILQTRWNQSTHNNMSTSLLGELCYNYYTPNNYYAGCVATAMSQIMRYFRYPTQSISPKTINNLTMQGGVYDWANMPQIPAVGLPENQRQAIGKLLSDVGISVKMNYGATSSGTATSYAYDAFKNIFQYANTEIQYFYSQNTAKNLYSDERMRNLLLSSFDAGFPCLLGIGDNSGGHAVVADGYGFSGSTLYLHVNMGWSGISDAWYNPPAIGTYSGITQIIYNIYPTGEGMLVSGRITDKNEEPLENAQVSIRNSSNIWHTTTNHKGIYSFRLPAGDYTLESTYLTDSASTAISVKKVTSTYFYNNTLMGVGDEVDGNSWGNDLTLSEIECVATPTANVADKTRFDIFQYVTLTSATKDAEIRYTLDGSTPTKTSQIYSGQLTFTKTTTLNFRAFKDDFSPSSVATVSVLKNNDLFANATAISGVRGTDYADNTDYSYESNEPLHSGLSSILGGPSAWWEWKAPASGRFFFSTEGSVKSDGSILPTYLSIYTGMQLNNLTKVAVDNYTIRADFPFRAVAFDAIYDKTYLIAVDSDSYTYGMLKLSWNTVMMPEPEIPTFAEMEPYTPEPKPAAVKGTKFSLR